MKIGFDWPLTFVHEKCGGEQVIEEATFRSDGTITFKLFCPNCDYGEAFGSITLSFLELTARALLADRELLRDAGPCIITPVPRLTH